MAKKQNRKDQPADPMERAVIRGGFRKQCFVAFALIHLIIGYRQMRQAGSWSKDNLNRAGRSLLDFLQRHGFDANASVLHAHAIYGVLLNVAVFLGSLLLILFAARLLAPVIGLRDHLYAKWCIALTRNSRMTGWLLIGSGFALTIVSTVYLLQHDALVALTRFLPLIAGLGMLFAALGVAVLSPLPILLAPPRPLEVRDPSPPRPGPARITGEEFLARLRRSPIFRRQIHFDNIVGEVPFIGGERGVDRYVGRFPRMEPILERIGISALSHDQATAVGKILENEAGGKPMDYLFVGRPGSGRTTTANLITLGAALQKEGAIYCITPDSPEQDVDFDSEGSRRAVRHAATQLREWISLCRLDDTISVTESYRLSQTPGDIDVDADIVVTDARIFSQANEARAARLLSRLRYVVVDQPERLSREDFVKLRIALCRLRLVAEMMGRPLTFIVILPRLNNNPEVGVYLLNHSNVESVNFGSWAGPCHVVGWMPALEIANADQDDVPRFARANFIDEVTALLSEIGAQANDLTETIRVAVTDAQPLLGPEARERIREAVRDQLARAQREGPRMMRASWTYFTAIDVGVERQGEYDVVICLGAGRHPRETIASVRPAIAANGVIIVVADSSPADLDTFDVMASPGWSPEIEDQRQRYPTLLLPDHSDAVLAYELARLFEDFPDPLPVDRLLQVFPGRGVAALLKEWERKGYIGPTEIFGDLREGNWPRRRDCLRRIDRAFRGDLFEIPWGCCSRDVYSIFDKSANRQVMAGAYLNDWVDADRLFIDFHPVAALRYRPNSVLVTRTTQRDVSAGAPDHRFVDRGTVEIQQMQRDDAIRIDRRTPRIHMEILSESSPDPRIPGPEVTQRGQVTIATMAPLLRAGEEDGTAILQRLSTLQVGTVATTPIGLIGGEWYTRIRERIRDIVRTDARLVEEPDFTSALPMPLRSVTTRDYECVAINLFLQLNGTAPSGKDDLRPSWAPMDPMQDYASYHGLARVMAEVLRRDFLNFDREFRVAVVPNSQRVVGISPFRVVIYKLRSDELGWEHTLSSILEPEDLGDTFNWVHDRLESCDCRNGCSRCCGGIGTTPAGGPTLFHFAEQDHVSRTGAYLLGCGLLGRTPDWERFREHSVAAGEPPISDRQLARFVEQLIGTAAGNFRDGVWHDLYGDYMTLDRSFAAEALWMDDATDRPDCAGYYSSGSNQIFIRPGPTLSFLRETIFHEFVHNWQFKGGVFDLETHLQSPAVRQYYDGKLIIEGHAVWSEQNYRLSERRGPVYSPGDGHPWNEYKAGFLLMEAIEKVVGQAGLFAWLSRGAKSPHIRSRDPRIPWPFTLDQAIDKLNLRRYMRRQVLTGFDVDDREQGWQSPSRTEPTVPPAESSN